MTERLLLANMNSGKALSRLIFERGLSREEAAKGIGCADTHVSALKIRKAISGSMLVKVCEFFEVTASEYFKLGEE